ncbi:hypothetical protein GF339_05970 [candidate division KSB3 bacterium]|uniref:NurA domain-containing protein n=1 Tax=candidate division KSB3 bacterium TaxID=2044937 RepID=A0A9D5JTZ1_9BACT|nr:hypothetical protein [candidate division KSB3 bacterium]MBD3324110.1 hypothetical protein [candidate division KSB3 bacterium]
MLDVLALHHQIHAMMSAHRDVRRRYDDQLARAQDTLGEWTARWRELVEKLAQSRTSWLVADDIHAPLQTTSPLPACPSPLTVIATDGSQIYPDRHEFASCYLINIGIVVLPYGTRESPMLHSQPRLFYRDEEISRIWNGKQVPVTSEIVAALRGAYEIDALAAHATHAAATPRPTVAMTDGTLILWQLEGKPKEFQHEILSVYLQSFEHFHAQQIPVMGYISQPGSADVINVLRVALCPENPTNCDRCPYKGREQELPCEPIAEVTDASLFAHILGRGERTQVFQSRSTILNEYGSHHIHFFYLNVGAELVRIEIPRWVAATPALLAQVHAVAYDQAQKGQGYPVSLSEAHEQAVIRSDERAQFYRILEQCYVREGVAVNLSRKALKKRTASI